MQAGHIGRGQDHEKYERGFAVQTGEVHAALAAAHHDKHFLQTVHLAVRDGDAVSDAGGAERLPVHQDLGRTLEVEAGSPVPQRGNEFGQNL